MRKNIKSFGSVLAILLLPLTLFSQQKTTTVTSPYYTGNGATPTKYYKLNRTEFLEKYGTDETSRNVINYYFRRRSLGVGGIVLGATVGGVAAVKLGAALAPVAISGTASTLIATGLGVGVVLLILGPIQIASYPRYRLYRILANYHENHSLPADILRKLRKKTHKR